MDHPNIAKILDAGTTESGRPYFVMDYVRGIPVTEYCDQNELTTSKRLAIFIDICQGVQHAHQKGIIHRDLKPGNVLVYLALAQYRSNQWQDAAHSIQQAMDLRQDGDAFDWLLLAMAQWQLGQKDAALEKYSQAQEAIKTGKPLFYEYLGVMAVQRLQQEAEVLMEGAVENANEEEGERVPSTESGVHGRAVASDRWLCRRQGLELDERYAWED